LSPYIPSAIRPAFTPTYLSQDFIYTKGTVGTASDVEIYNSMTGAEVGCVQVYKGYYLSFFTSFNQKPITLNDGGLDPDAIESWAGDVRFRPGISCP
jgi:hypothetical protein